MADRITTLDERREKRRASWRRYDEKNRRTIAAKRRASRRLARKALERQARMDGGKKIVTLGNARVRRHRARKRFRSGPRRWERMRITTFEDMIEALRQRRVELGYSQVDADDICGLAPGHIGKIEVKTAKGATSQSRHLGPVSFAKILRGYALVARLEENYEIHGEDA